MRYRPAPRFSGSTPAKRTACAVPWNSGAKSLPWACLRRQRLQRQRRGETLADEILHDLDPRAGVEPRVSRFPDPRAETEPAEKHRHQQAEQRDRDQQLEQREAMLCHLPRATIAHSDGRPARSVVSVNCSAGLGPHVTVTCTW